MVYACMAYNFIVITGNNNNNNTVLRNMSQHVCH